MPTATTGTKGRAAQSRSHSMRSSAFERSAMKPMNPSISCRASALALLGALSWPCAAADTPWPVAGQQGLVRFVIVPAAQAGDQAAYAVQIDRLCEPERTCFLNFYTNSTGAAVAVPLPDAIDKEATATFRRSAKQGAQRFQWSCRMKQAEQDCF